MINRRNLIVGASAVAVTAATLPVGAKDMPIIPKSNYYSEMTIAERVEILRQGIDNWMVMTQFEANDQVWRIDSVKIISEGIGQLKLDNMSMGLHIPEYANPQQKYIHLTLYQLIQDYAYSIASEIRDGEVHTDIVKHYSRLELMQGKT